MYKLGPIRTRIKESEDITANYLKLLPVDHILRTLFLEHQVIISLITHLDELRDLIWEMDSPIDHSDVFERLLDVMEKLTLSNIHHVREEQILFPELTRRDIHKFHHVLTAEHVFIRGYKTDFLSMVKSMGTTDFHTYKLQLNFQANGIIGLLREHIYRENTVVYPLALESISDSDCWSQMQDESCKIGYSLTESVA